jgi:hypothetical protein
MLNSSANVMAYALTIFLLVSCSPGPGFHQDETPPILTIDEPDEDDLICANFTVEGRARDLDPGLASVTLYVDGEKIETVILSGDAESYDFGFDMDTEDFPVDCGEVEIEVVAADGEGNEDSENVDVVLCDDTTDPVVTMIADNLAITLIDDCAHVTVTVDELNFLEYVVTGFGGIIIQTSSGYSFSVCGSELIVGENTILFTVTDICSNEGFDSISLTYDPQPCTFELIAPVNGATLCEGLTFQACFNFEHCEDILIEEVTFWICGVPYEGVLNGGCYEVSLNDAWDDLGAECTWYVTVESNVGNDTSDTWAFTVDCVDPVVEITFPLAEDYLCGEVTFLADAAYRDLPGIEEVCFYFDGEDEPRHCDATAPYEYAVDVNSTFEPETHSVFAMAILEDGSEVPSPVIPWVKNCDPLAIKWAR